MTAAFRALDVTTVYRSSESGGKRNHGRGAVRAIENVDLTVHAGEMVLLMGPSGLHFKGADVGVPGLAEDPSVLASPASKKSTRKAATSNPQAAFSPATRRYIRRVTSIGISTATTNSRFYSPASRPQATHHYRGRPHRRQTHRLVLILFVAFPIQVYEVTGQAAADEQH